MFSSHTTQLSAWKSQHLLRSPSQQVSHCHLRRAGNSLVTCSNYLWEFVKSEHLRTRTSGDPSHHSCRLFKMLVRVGRIPSRSHVFSEAINSLLEYHQWVTQSVLNILFGTNIMNRKGAVSSRNLVVPVPSQENNYERCHFHAQAAGSTSLGYFSAFGQATLLAKFLPSHTTFLRAVFCKELTGIRIW